MQLVVSDRVWAWQDRAQALPVLSRHGVVGTSVSLSRLEQEVKTSRQTLFTRARAHLKEFRSYGLDVVCFDQVVPSFPHSCATSSFDLVFEKIHQALDAAIEFGVPRLDLTAPFLASFPLSVLSQSGMFKGWNSVSTRAQSKEIELYVEPVARIYGARSFQTSFDVSSFFSDFGICVGLDTTALLFEESPKSTLTRYAGQVDIFSVSEPALAPFVCRTQHKEFDQILSRLQGMNRAPEFLSLKMARSCASDLDKSLKRLRVTYALSLRGIEKSGEIFKPGQIR